MIVCDFFFFLKWTPPPSKPRALCHRWFRPWQELQSASPFKGQKILTFPDRNVSQENSGFCRCPTKLYVQLLIDVGWWWTAWSLFVHTVSSEFTEFICILESGCRKHWRLYKKSLLRAWPVGCFLMYLWNVGQVYFSHFWIFFALTHARTLWKRYRQKRDADRLSLRAHRAYSETPTMDLNVEPQGWQGIE